MYDIEKIWKNVLEQLKIPINSEISTDGIYNAIQKVTSFVRPKTIKNIILTLETKGFIKKSDNIGIWIILKDYTAKEWGV